MWNELYIQAVDTIGIAEVQCMQGYLQSEIKEWRTILKSTKLVPHVSSPGVQLPLTTRY